MPRRGKPVRERKCIQDNLRVKEIENNIKAAAKIMPTAGMIKAYF